MAKKRAQTAFNSYIRARDAGKGCVSCASKTPSHAGHYRSVGACPALRFNEDNCHLQCAKCNTHLSGNLIPYRIELIKRIGAERLAFLEADHAPKRYRLADFEGIAAEYREKRRLLLKS